MWLDNLFAMAGAPGTAAMLFAIVAFVGIPAAGSVFCPRVRRPIQRSR
jgi:hypothetical protein